MPTAGAPDRSAAFDPFYHLYFCGELQGREGVNFLSAMQHRTVAEGPVVGWLFTLEGTLSLRSGLGLVALRPGQAQSYRSDYESGLSRSKRDIGWRAIAVIFHGALALRYWQYLTRRFGGEQTCGVRNEPLRAARALARAIRHATPFVEADRAHAWLATWHDFLETQYPNEISLGGSRVAAGSKRTGRRYRNFGSPLPSRPALPTCSFPDRRAMKRLPPPDVLLRQWLQEPHAITVAAFAISGVFLAVAAWKIRQNLLLNDPGISAANAFVFALAVTTTGVVGASRLPSPWNLVVIVTLVSAAGILFYFADHRRYVRDPAGRIVADRWQIALRFAGFQWTRDKANRHFFFTGDTGSGKTTGMNALLADLVKRNPTLGGVVMANKGDEWFYLEWLAKKHGRQGDIIRLRPRLVGEPGPVLHRLNVTGDASLPFTTRARILVDTAAALNPRDEKGFFKVKGAAHIGRAFELLAEIGRPVTATNAYDLLTSERELKAALEKLTELEPTERRIRLAETLEQTYLKHEAKEQRAGEIGTSQNYLEYLGTAEIAEIFSSNEPDTCTIADVDRGKIFCIDVPQDYTTERQYVFTVVKLLLYRHALRRYALPPWQKYALNQLVYVGDEFQNAITASHDGTSDFNVIDRLRDCMLMLVVSAQAFESLIPPQTKEQAEVLALNLKNLVMYRAASEADALRCANALGKHWVERASRTVHHDHTSHAYQRIEEFRIKPHEFRGLPDHTAVVRHCTNGFKKVSLRPS